MVPNSYQLGQAIRRLRKRSGRKIEPVALEAEVHTKTLGDLEREGGNPSWDVLEAVMKELGIDATELMQLASTLPATKPPQAAADADDGTD